MFQLGHNNFKNCLSYLLWFMTNQTLETTVNSGTNKNPAYRWQWISCMQIVDPIPNNPFKKSGKEKSYIFIYICMCHMSRVTCVETVVKPVFELVKKSKTIFHQKSPVHREKGFTEGDRQQTDSRRISQFIDWGFWKLQHLKLFLCVWDHSYLIGQGN